MSPRYACRHGNATRYKRVIERDEQGQMRPSARYRCSRCSVMFTDAKAWRQVQSEPVADAPSALEQRVQT